jgi:outer membrane protein OmpA-like peptidoglycan-associated protein
METLNKSKHFELYRSRVLWAFTSLWLTNILTPTASANMNSHATQTFSPAMGSQDFATVQSSSTIPSRHFNLGLFVNHAADTLPYQAERQGKLSNTLTSMDLMVGYGVTSNLEFGVFAPFAVHQSVSDQQTHSEFLERGNTELRPYAKIKLHEQGTFGLGIQTNININRTIDNPYAGGGSALGASVEIAADWIHSAVRLGFNLGYRYQQKGKELSDALVKPVGDRYLASAGLGIPVAASTSLVGELYGSAPTTGFENQTDRRGENLEALVGLQQKFSKRTKGQLGLTSEALHGLNTADWRIYLGINQLFGPGERTSAKPTIVRKKSPRPIRDFVVKPEIVPASISAPARNEPRELTPEQVPTETPAEVFVLRDVHFEFDSDHQILRGGMIELEKVANKLRTMEFDQIVVEGHCDYYGTDDYNDDLSMRRSRNVARHLIRQHGMDAAKMNFVGFGERRPKTPDTSDFGRQVNRRVEIKVFRNGSLELSSQ